MKRFFEKNGFTHMLKSPVFQDGEKWIFLKREFWRGVSHFFYRGKIRPLGQEGFTLIELLLVMLIISLMAGMSMPALRTYQTNLAINSLARDLASDLRYIQQVSVTEQVNHAIDFDDINDKYDMIRRGSPDEIIDTKNLSGGIDFSQINFSGDCVEFNPYGAVRESGDVVLQDSAGSTITIEIRPSGFIEVIE